MKEQAVAGERSIQANVALESAGAVVSRYGLVVILLLIGILKFTPAEADGIRPLVAHSPFMSWMYLVLSKQGVSNFVGVVELLIALLLALRPPQDMSQCYIPPLHVIHFKGGLNSGEAQLGEVTKIPFNGFRQCNIITLRSKLAQYQFARDRYEEERISNQ